MVPKQISSQYLFFGFKTKLGGAENKLRKTSFQELMKRHVHILITQNPL